MASGSQEIPSSDRHARKTGRRARFGWIGISEKEKERKEQEERNSSVFFWLREESEPTRAASGREK